MSYNPTILGYRHLPIPGAAPLAVLHPVFELASGLIAEDTQTYRGRKDLLAADDKDLELWASCALDRAQAQLGYEVPADCEQPFIDELVGVLRATREDL